jgi:sigma-B regulation protein RsbU (phosphoserine phosphatase)
MAAPEEIHENIWLHFYKFIRLRLGFLTIGANLIGALIVTCYFTFFDAALTVEQIKDTFIVLGVLFIGLVILASIVINSWQKDLWRFVRLKANCREIDPALHRRAQRVVLDLPFMSAMMSLFNWLVAAIIMSLNTALRLTTENAVSAVLIDASRTFIGIIIGGIVVCAIIFFSVEIVCRRVWPYFFPEGGMVKSPCTFRLKLPVRMLIIFSLASLLPIILMAVLSYNKAKLIGGLSFDSAEFIGAMNPEEVIRSLLYSTAFLLATALGVAIILSRLFSTAIIRPVSRMEDAMARLGNGDLTVAVPVENNDELGALSEHFNQMTIGLKERYELRRSLDLAREVQQNLLPRDNPAVKGLDIAGKSIYCDETGGDYFDFLESENPDGNKFAVVIGDVSEHGIPSALLMATARAFIRQRSAMAGSIARVVSDVNRQLTRDVEETGRFMTLFYLLVDVSRKRLHWVRAGHDPAMLYDPANDRWQELGGEGIALGIDENWQYREYEKAGLTGGQVIILSTDGLWEAQNQQGDMFGKDAIYDIIRRNSAAGARELLDTLIDAVTRFQKGRQRTDDITLVIVKVNDSL